MSGIVVLACAGRAVNQSAILGPPLGAKIFTLLFFLLTILEAWASSVIQHICPGPTACLEALHSILISVEYLRSQSLEFDATSPQTSSERCQIICVMLHSPPDDRPSIKIMTTILGHRHTIHNSHPTQHQGKAPIKELQSKFPKNQSHPCSVERKLVHPPSLPRKTY